MKARAVSRKSSCSSLAQGSETGWGASRSCGGSSHRLFAKWHARRVSFDTVRPPGRASVLEARRVERQMPISQPAPGRRRAGRHAHRLRARRGAPGAASGRRSSMARPARMLTYAELADGRRSLRRRAGRARARARARSSASSRPTCPEYAIVFHGVARAGGDEHDRQRALHGRGGRLPASRRGRALPRDRPPLLDRARRAAAARRRRRGDLRHRRGGRRRRRSPTCSRPPARRPARSPIDPADDVVVAAVLERHDRAVQGRDADAPQPRREHRAVRRRAAASRDGRDASSPCCRSSTSTACRSLMNCGLRVGRDDRHDAALRPRAVPRGRSSSTRVTRSLRRAADRASRWPSTRSSTSTTCPACAGLLRRGAARRRADLERRRARSAARSCRATA